MTKLRTSMWLYPWDVQDEGIGPVLDHIQDRAGVKGINLAVSYHSGMFLLPHNPRRKVYYPLPGIYFQPNAGRFADLAMQPTVNDLASTGLLERLRSETARRGMALTAWTVCLHNTGLGLAYPESTMETAFGDRLISQLCPANPDVRAYVLALVGDLLDRAFDSVLVESLEYMSLPHGYHHEVIGVPLTPFVSWLLGLCFCEHCRRGAEAWGVDIKALLAFVRGEIEVFFAGDMKAGREGTTWPEIKALAGGELGAFHQFRIHTVTSLYKAIDATETPGTTVALEACDFGPLWGLGPDGTAWESGFDLAGTAPFVDGLHPCPYFVSAGQVREAMEAYLGLAPPEIPVFPAIRAIPPQVVSEGDLRAKLEACQPGSVAGFSFYNYGFMRYNTLDWIRAALAALNR
jgi:hypothetical protein